MINHYFYASTFVLFASFSFYAIYDAQPKSYMDEVFHIPQVQTYCHGNFSYWDPMITTLPGLYLVSIGILKPVQKIFVLDTDTICSVLWLRSVNILFGLGNFYLLYRLIYTINKEMEASTIAFSALTLSCFPLLFFFNLLYYTDVGSTFTVLLMYLLHLQHNRLLAASIGILSIMFRQTNVIWVVFVAGLQAQSILLQWTVEQRETLKKKNTNTKHDARLTDDLTISEVLHVFVESLRKDFSKTCMLFVTILKDCLFYIIVIIGFLIFVYVNGGFVVGDKSHHTACLHFPQLFYFASFTMAFSASHFVTVKNIIVFLNFLKTNYLKAFLFVIASSTMIYYFTYTHIYLLSDNRHYTFYLWARLYNRHFSVKYILIPVYLYSCFIFMELLKCKNVTWKAVFSICVVASLVPQKLIEFRYFIIPYLIFRLNIKQGHVLQEIIELLLYIVLNAVTIYLFVNKPFIWENESGFQRFMW